MFDRKCYLAFLMKLFKNIGFRFFLVLGTLFTLSGCVHPYDAEDLYVEWKDIKIESPQEDPPGVKSGDELAQESPSIIFSKNNDLVIMWGGKRLSHGKFRLEGKQIIYNENLEGGNVREFPFLIRELTEKEIIFETLGQNSTRVTAQKL